MKYLSLGLVFSGLFLSPLLHAAETILPWGTATEINQVYSKQKVVFDTTSASVAGLTQIKAD